MFNDTRINKSALSEWQVGASFVVQLHEENLESLKNYQASLVGRVLRWENQTVTQK